VYFHRLRGDLAAALDECERALAVIAPGGEVQRSAALFWCAIASSHVDTLVDMDRWAEAKEHGGRALASCAEIGIGQMSCEIARGVALAEAKLGDFAGAAARLDAIILTQQGYGGRGLILGTTYEARTRVAIWASDAAAAERFGQLAAQEFRHGRATPLGARYERLMEEARSAGLAQLPNLDSLAVSRLSAVTVRAGGRSSVENSVLTALEAAEDARARAAVALQLVCDAHAASGGHLYVLRHDGLVRAASSAGHEADEHLRRFVASFWERQLVEPDLPTAFVPEGTPPPASSSEVWTDGHGTPYHPVLISAAQGGDLLHVGVAVLRPSDRPDRNPSANHVTGTVGSYLLSSGDAIGVDA
jgi:hypothetical protein